MNARLLFENFETLAAAPDGVAKLREMILQLAVQGKLVKQDPDDEPAEVLLEKIKKEKKRLVREGKIRKGKQLPPISSEEIPFQLPQKWMWERLGNYAYINMGQSPKSFHYNTEGRGLPFYQGKTNFGDIFPYPTNWCDRPTKIAEKNDILISVRAPVGPTNICQEKSCIGRGLAGIQSLSGSNHLFLLFALRAFEKQVAEMGVGSTFVAISRSHLDGFLIPVPPSTEQKRIVAKVDELMALCDKIEENLEKSKEQSGKLLEAVVRGVVSG